MKSKTCYPNRYPAHRAAQVPLTVPMGELFPLLPVSKYTEANEKLPLSPLCYSPKTVGVLVSWTYIGKLVLKYSSTSKGRKVK